MHMYVQGVWWVYSFTIHFEKIRLEMFKFGNKHITIGSIFNAVGTKYFLFKYYLNYMFTVGFDCIGFCHLTCKYGYNI